MQNDLESSDNNVSLLIIDQPIVIHFQCIFFSIYAFFSFSLCFTACQLKWESKILKTEHGNCESDGEVTYTYCYGDCWNSSSLPVLNLNAKNLCEKYVQMLYRYGKFRIVFYVYLIIGNLLSNMSRTTR